MRTQEQGQGQGQGRLCTRYREALARNKYLERVVTMFELMLQRYASLGYGFANLLQSMVSQLLARDLAHDHVQLETYCAYHHRCPNET